MPLNPPPYNAPLALPPSCHFPFSHFHFLPSLTPFKINTYETSRKCCRQRTYGIAKSFRFHTYKKHGGWGVLWLTRHASRHVCPVYPQPRRERPFGARALSRKEQLAAPGLSRILACPLDMGRWLQVTALSISARAFRKRAERNSRLALSARFANTHWHRGRFDLPLFSWLQCQARFLSQSPVRAEQPQPYRQGRNSHALRDFLRRILQNIAQQTDLPQIRSKLLDGIRQMLAHLAP